MKYEETNQTKLKMNNCNTKWIEIEYKNKHITKKRIHYPEAPSLSQNTPVDSQTYMAPTSPQGICAGSFSWKTRTFIPLTTKYSAVPSWKEKFQKSFEYKAISIGGWPSPTRGCIGVSMYMYIVSAPALRCASEGWSAGSLKLRGYIIWNILKHYANDAVPVAPGMPTCHTSHQIALFLFCHCW